MDTTLSPSHACLSYMRTFEHKFNNAHLHEGPATVVPADQRQPMAPVVSAALQHAMEEAEIEHLRFARDVRPIQSDHPAEAGYQPIMRGGTNVSDNGMGELHGNRANAWRPDASAAYALVRAGHMRVLSISSSTSTTQAKSSDTKASSSPSTSLSTTPSASTKASSFLTLLRDVCASKTF